MNAACSFPAANWTWRPFAAGGRLWPENATFAESSPSVPLESSADVVTPLDWQEIRSAISGDGNAYGRLVARYQQAIARYLWRFSRDPLVHEELVQTVFVEAFFQLKTFAGRSPLIHWLQVIATRTGYRYWKSQRRRWSVWMFSSSPVTESTVADSRLSVDPSTPLEAEEEVARLHECLAQLSPRDRLVITLLHLEEKSVAEIAGLTGWSQAMVKVQAFRARGKLAVLLKERQP